MTPVDQLRAAAATDPDARIHWRGQSLSYADLLDRSLRCAGGLRSRGVKAGDRVAFWLPNCLAYLDLLYACFHLGAIAVSLNTRYRRGEAEAILSRSRASALVIWPDFKGIPFLTMLSEIDPAALRALRLAILFESDRCDVPLPGVAVAHHRDLLQDAAIAGDAAEEMPGIVFPTTGTTGLPKFALHRQGCIARHASRVAPAFGYDAPGAHLLQAIPFCGIWGFSQWIGTAAGAASSTLMTLFDPAEAGRLIRDRGVTHLNGSDDLLKRLLDAQAEPRPFPSLREAVYASFNPTLPHFIQEADRRGVTVVNAFGMSEIYSLFSRQRADAAPKTRKASGGFLVDPGAEVRIRDPETGALAASGVVGALEIRSDTLFCGYLDDPDATREAFTPDGFFRSGDLGALVGDGSFLFKGRSGDVLRLGGFMVNPVEIETVLQGVGGIAEAIVVEIADARGNQPVAFVRCPPDVAFDEAAVRARVRAELAAFKAPRHYVRLDAFPTAMGPNGEKIQRGRLKEVARATFSAANANHPMREDTP